MSFPTPSPLKRYFEANAFDPGWKTRTCIYCGGHWDVKDWNRLGDPPVVLAGPYGIEKHEVHCKFVWQNKESFTLVTNPGLGGKQYFLSRSSGV